MFFFEHSISKIFTRVVKKPKKNINDTHKYPQKFNFKVRTQIGNNYTMEAIQYHNNS